MKTILRTAIILIFSILLITFSESHAQARYNKVKLENNYTSSHKNFNNNFDAFQNNNFDTNKIGIKVYPNPTFGKITIEGVNSGYVRIFEINGQMVFNSNITSDRSQYNLNKLSPGVYLLQIHSSEKITTKKIVVQ